MKKLLSLVIVVLFGALLARTCLYTVNEREYALVFMLGELKSVVSTPGLHVKLPAPLQNVVYLDKRILTIDTPAADLVQTDDRFLCEVAHQRSAPLLGFFPRQRTSRGRSYVCAAS